MVHDPLSQAAQWDERLERLPVLAEGLRANTVISAVYVGYPNGEFLLIRPLNRPELHKDFGAPPNAGYLLQLIRRPAPDAIQGEWWFLRPDLQVLQRDVRPEYRYDPRTRPWFHSGTEPTLSRPYRFFTTAEAGMTLSQRNPDSQAVVGMKLPLSQVAGQALTLLVVVPATELLGNARNELSRQLLWLVGLLPVALLLGLALARRVVAPLRALAGQVQRLAPGCTTAARSPARTTSSTRPPSSKPCTTAFTRYARVSKCCGVMPTSPGSTRLAAKPGGATLMTGSASRAPKKPPWPRCHPAPCPRAKPCWPTVRNT